MFRCRASSTWLTVLAVFVLCIQIYSIRAPCLSDVGERGARVNGEDSGTWLDQRHGRKGTGGIGAIENSTLGVGIPSVPPSPSRLPPSSGLLASFLTKADTDPVGNSSRRS